MRTPPHDKVKTVSFRPVKAGRDLSQSRTRVMASQPRFLYYFCCSCFAAFFTYWFMRQRGVKHKQDDSYQSIQNNSKDQQEENFQHVMIRAHIDVIVKRAHQSLIIIEPFVTFLLFVNIYYRLF